MMKAKVINVECINGLHPCILSLEIDIFSASQSIILGDSILHAIAARLSQKNGQPTANKELQRALSSTKASSNSNNHPTSSNNDSQLLQKLFGNNFSQSNSLYPECSADNNNV